MTPVVLIIAVVVSRLRVVVGMVKGAVAILTVVGSVLIMLLVITVLTPTT